ncbi:ribonuclease domain-containing protein [Gordonia sp. NPDC003424]
MHPSTHPHRRTISWLLVTAVAGLLAACGAMPATTATTTSTTAAVPARVTATLALIDAGRWPDAADAPGTKGGTVFRNNEGHLPKTGKNGSPITYREWDVNPKKPGKSRDAERIVTGSDGSAWYTDDHYQSFVMIRGPST